VGGAPNSGVVGFVIVDMVDGAAHIEQVSVVPGHQGQGVGRALIDQVGRWAGENGLTALTLTTFNDVPWNRPLYEHLGFRVLAAEEIAPGLHAVMAAEAAHGLDPATRVAMRKDSRLEMAVPRPSPGSGVSPMVAPPAQHDNCRVVAFRQSGKVVRTRSRKALTSE
jgi:hypothetical protein